MRARKTQPHRKAEVLAVTSEKKVQKVYREDFKRQAVELTIHSGRSIVQIGRELGVSEATLHASREGYGPIGGPGGWDLGGAGQPAPRSS
ncbi:MAG: transposase [Verrucomicrobia bacterium]|nr:transposase [Verrucomicrobiota bacterium]